MRVTADSTCVTMHGRSRSRRRPRGDGTRGPRTSSVNGSPQYTVGSVFAVAVSPLDGAMGALGILAVMLAAAVIMGVAIGGCSANTTDILRPFIVVGTSVESFGREISSRASSSTPPSAILGRGRQRKPVHQRKSRSRRLLSCGCWNSRRRNVSSRHFLSSRATSISHMATEQMTTRHGPISGAAGRQHSARSNRWQ